MQAMPSIENCFLGLQNSFGWSSAQHVGQENFVFLDGWVESKMVA